MKIDYPKVQIDENDSIINLKFEQLLPVAALSYNSFSVGERVGGLLANKSFFLPDELDWIIVKDDQNQLCLVPLKKELTK